MKADERIALLTSEGAMKSPVYAHIQGVNTF